MSDTQYKKKVRDALKEREHIAMLRHRFDTRITNVKLGKAAFVQGDFLTAIRKYTEYLETVAEVKKASSIYNLNTNHFDKNKDMTEMMMISHLYFELAKVYDATGKFEDDLKGCLDQFVQFSINQPFQVVNSEMCRKHLRKYKFKNHLLFQNSYQQIFVNSRKCYIATHCFGDHHPTTQKLRALKTILLKRSYGFFMVRLYYKTSPTIVRLLDNNPRIAFIVNPMLKGLIKFFSDRITINKSF